MAPAVDPNRVAALISSIKVAITRANELPSIPADWDETDPESGRPKGSIALSALIDGLDHQQLQLLNAIKSRNNVSGGELVEMYWKEVREQCIGEEDAESEETKSGTKGKSQAGK